MRCNVYKHRESGKLLFITEHTLFPSDFNKAFWNLLLVGSLAPPHVAHALGTGGPYHVTTIAAVEKL